MPYLFTSESVSEGHPDKVADQISDAILDEILKQDPNSKCACETFVTTGLVMVGGEVKTEAYVDVQEIARDVVRRIGYTKPDYRFDADSCGVISSIHEQSPDINQGVDRDKEEEQGAGDQGMMFGFATNETEQYMPLPVDIAHRLVEELADIRRHCGKMPYLRPDSKSQVTFKYDDDGKPLGIDTIVVSTQHDEFVIADANTPEAQKRADNQMLSRIETDIRNILIPQVAKTYSPEIQKYFETDFRLLVNPTGKFVIGGPHGDTGLTGRKIIVDTYGGRGAHGGGAFSGKDASKVDRSAAYAARHIAKNIVAAGVAEEALVQLAYAIGVAEPVGVYVDLKRSKVDMNNAEAAEKIKAIFDLRPHAIIKRFGLKHPIFEETAAYGHMGRTPGKKVVRINGHKEEIETFTWEKLDYVDEIKKAFNL
ncbi:MAG TPA: methionine adenosyltransferase [Salinivirga sp.]|uniref:methionine adenosyltransferase n=1 Tax=Salinivirga sp. TaxID=1970192 RepID=UPI002B466FBD|nr:methionine adenosyltransferase [Salinivirga sp.]HKK59791.1 methionine adenosyltransferase [Salinivirga sp.]